MKVTRRKHSVLNRMLHTHGTTHVRNAMSRMTTTLASTHTGHHICCAVVYVSEGRDGTLLDSLARLADKATDGAGLIKQFRDPIYHRTGFTIGGKPSCVAHAALEVSRLALRSIDLRVHHANHPRVGVIDHISIHPLGSAPADERALETCRSIAENLGNEGLPILLYGSSNNGRQLAEVSICATNNHVHSCIELTSIHHSSKTC